jgi:phosphopantothenoylcysteine decarboxylase
MIGEPHRMSPSRMGSRLCSIFAPATSRDARYDEALALRIEALNDMGLDLGHLGLLVPQPDESGLDVGAALRSLAQECGAALQQLSKSTCRSPRDQLAALVSAHQVVVEGLASLPKIELKDDAVPDAVKIDASDAATKSSPPAEKAASPPALPATKPRTSSADLILPMLIYSIVLSNPRQLHSHLLFIQRFRTESLLRGQESYCLVNVQAAVAFLANVDPRVLGLGDDLSR